MHRAFLLLLQVRLDCKGALDEVWENVEALEAAHTTLASRVEGVEDDLKHVGVDLRSVHEHTDKLDTYVNDMLKEMLGALNQSRPPPLLPHLVQLCYNNTELIACQRISFPC